MEKLVRIVHAGIADDGTITAKYVKDSLRALSEINKIQGHYAPEKNFNLSMEMGDVQETKLHELILKYDRDC